MAGLFYSLITCSAIAVNDGVVGFKANAGGAVGRGMELTRDLFGGRFNIVIGLAGNQNHTKAKAECHYKTKNRFFHHRISFPQFKGGDVQYYCIKTRGVCQYFFIILTDFFAT